MLYKVCERAEWEEARIAGVYLGAPVDLADGFIHFSTAAQLPETLARHFSGREGLVLLAVLEAALEELGLDEAVKWEVSRGGALFPHLYAPLPVAAVRWEEPLSLAPDGTHLLPELVD
jgi:uncharacterized protein (DUF952 family)